MDIEPPSFQGRWWFGRCLGFEGSGFPNFLARYFASRGAHPSAIHCWNVVVLPLPSSSFCTRYLAFIHKLVFHPFDCKNTALL